MTREDANRLACGLAAMQIESGMVDDTWPQSLEEDPHYGYPEEDRVLIIEALESIVEGLRSVADDAADTVTFTALVSKGEE